MKPNVITCLIDLEKGLWGTSIVGEHCRIVKYSEEAEEQWKKTGPRLFLHEDTTFIEELIIIAINRQRGSLERETRIC